MHNLKGKKYKLLTPFFIPFTIHFNSMHIYSFYIFLPKMLKTASFVCLLVTVSSLFSENVTASFIIKMYITIILSEANQIFNCKVAYERLLKVFIVLDLSALISKRVITLSHSTVHSYSEDKFFFTGHASIQNH